MKKIIYISLLLFFCHITVGIALIQTRQQVFAEQFGSSPESGMTSRIKTASDWLVVKGTNYGSTDSPDWSNNWGTMWNRIMEAAAWEPDGTATVADVVSGKTFYAGNGDRTMKIGNASIYFSGITQNYSNQSFTQYPDNSASDNTSEEVTWINTATNVWKDSQTGLYWSNNLGNYTNNFTVSSCDFFITSPRSSYAGSDTDCGNTINTCANLSLDSTGDAVPETDWYLLSHKELLQAYVDGMYNQAGAVFTTTERYWTSITYSGFPTFGIVGYLNEGTVGNTSKANSRPVRCVRRD